MKDLYFGVREFQAHIGRALRAVREGHRVVITSRNREVAAVVKPERSQPARTALDRKLDRLAAEGYLRRSNGKRIKRSDIPIFELDGVPEQLRRDRDSR